MRQQISNRPADDDRGFSLIELVVTMAIMSMVTLVIVGATIEIYSGTKRIDNTAEARDQLDNSFRRLDRELRYATWVSDPAQASGTWYMDYAIPAGCRQLKLTDGVLTLRAWATAATPGPAAAIASGVVPINGTTPFIVYRAGAQPYATASPATGMGANYQLDFDQVRLLFNVKIGTVTMPFDSVFTAQNSTRETTTHTCSQGRPIP
ncbi:PulJ/GspJ family protein [Actinoplanes aureus]|uniref:Prepilin-type N-terminal cleavage/methylation domain-containing protein n=1 Tax=Actinoplanes aureus TaxID=2792083 RepID=A0A931C3E9_9ACTN|nr:prepilin-type N-terminal cleavage/methylation domain-containing protein [Actinoplanes aureus]MBG0560391.1 prepilin-type N-terminal cleavage/methylation domain-containing protein [Actinoplanes aureus]